MGQQNKCLIVDEMHESIFELLEQAGVEYTYRPEVRREEIIDLLTGYQVLLIRSKTRVDAELLTNANHLRVVGRAGAGVDNVDEDYLEDKGIHLINAPEGNMDAVGEQTIGMLLSLMHNVVKSHLEVTQYRTWDREGNRGVELQGKTVGIIGYGNMGKSVAKRLKMFGCKVIAYDKYLEKYEDEFCQEVSLSELQKLSDIITLHIPLAEETRMWVNASFFEQCKDGIYFLNLARGEIVSLASLKAAVESGKVKAVALDVLENEKLNQLTSEQQKLLEYFSNHSRAIITPHIGGWSIESYRKINNVLVEKLTSLLSIN